jgi:hypothetical protein
LRECAAISSASDGERHVAVIIAAGIDALERGAQVPSLDLSHDELVVRLLALEMRVKALEREARR